MPASNRMRGRGLSRGNLFDTNIKATSIDEDIFTDQTLLDAAADGDLMLTLDVSETPDVIKYMTRSTMLGGYPALTGNTNNTVVTVTGTDAVTGEANLTFNASTNILQIGAASDIEPRLDLLNDENSVQIGLANAADDMVVGSADGDLVINSVGDHNVIIAQNDTKAITLDTDGDVTFANNIDGGTWLGTTIAVANGGTGATSLSNLITMGTHTTGDYVATITAGTGLTSSAGTSGEDVDHSLSVDASQTQITAVGTIATGTWQATDIEVAHGGTGVSSLTDGGVLLGSGTGAITAMAVLSDGEMIVGDGTADPVAESGSTLRTSIGVAIGSDVQAYDAELAAIAGLTSAANKIPMFSGSESASLIDFKDEDAMGSNSATAVASQQSVKAYADTKATPGFTVAMSIAL